MSRKRSFLRQHSLGIVSAAILLLWILLYCVSDERTHIGSFYGNAIADWTGMLMSIIGTKYLFEVGSVESKQPMHKFLSWLPEQLYEHSLTIFVLITGVGWTVAFWKMDPNAKWGQVVGNLVSEWTQLLGIVWLTKELRERGSKESKR